MEKNKTLIIWLKNGKTFKFEEVEGFNEYEESITFCYFGVMTRVKRTARFHHENIAGYALEF